jgi:hypothetical protein
MKTHFHISQRDLERLGALLEAPAFNENALVVPVQGEEFTPGKTIWFVERPSGSSGLLAPSRWWSRSRREGPGPGRRSCTSAPSLSSPRGALTAGTR